MAWQLQSKGDINVLVLSNFNWFFLPLAKYLVQDCLQKKELIKLKYSDIFHSVGAFLKRLMQIKVNKLRETFKFNISL